MRNRERLLEAARTVFAGGGPDASLEAVARTAGVGIGTLYRHFPTREALFEAVYRREADELAGLAARLAAEEAPLDALRLWLKGAVRMVATKKGMLAALVQKYDAASTPLQDASALNRRSLEGLMARAQKGGAVRADVAPGEVLNALWGLCHAFEMPAQVDRILHLIDVFVDGLATPPPG
ncbi:helix-turn-helix domain-containing protein [Acuticoccus sp. MNP-M23]|uniref:TetR/AcrR family transcriptional regulator n=1 Tax=Acuticoccus sp. MNP-M23 TaxID=3072793 RepID=UPI0028168F91|nr:helix-turn-helix domain-containing protein [Acuticoccus sp. MNP-M23]WMS41387.1 helix-turn-helix domain-containing protein [Acuticoccus sp. MNP-M23]